MARQGEPLATAIAAALGVDASAASRLRTLRAHETIAAPAVVARGAVKLVSRDDVVLDLARAPYLALAGPFRCVALRGCHVAALDESALDPRVLARPYAELAASLVERAVARAAPTVEARLERLLDDLARRWGTRVSGGVFVALPLRGRDAASLLGTTTETISRIVAAWKRSGRVRATRDGIWIRARDPERRYAGSR